MSARKYQVCFAAADCEAEPVPSRNIGVGAKLLELPLLILEDLVEVKVCLRNTKQRTINRVRLGGRCLEHHLLRSWHPRSRRVLVGIKLVLTKAACHEVSHANSSRPVPQK